jgi:hypothetical protein
VCVRKYCCGGVGMDGMIILKLLDLFIYLLFGEYWNYVGVTSSGQRPAPEF